MVRFWCDHCGKEVDRNDVSIVSRASLEGKPHHLCKECKQKWEDMQLEFWRNETFTHDEFDQKCVSFLTRELKENSNEKV